MSRVVGGEIAVVMGVIKVSCHPAFSIPVPTLESQYSMYYHYIQTIHCRKVTPFCNFKCGFTFHIMFKKHYRWLTYTMSTIIDTNLTHSTISDSQHWQSLDPGPHPRRTPVVFPMADSLGPWRCNRQVGDKLETISTHKAPGFRISFGATLDRQNMTNSSFGCSCRVGKLDHKSTHELLGNYLRSNSGVDSTHTSIRTWVELERFIQL